MAAVIHEAASGNMKNEHIARLAMVLGQSGNYRPPLVDRHAADIASTGGPSSLSTLLGPLYLCSMDSYVPKLGVPGRPAGGVDTLAQIPNYKVQLTAQEVSECIGQCGYAHFLADTTHAPLDAAFFRLRQRVGAQSIPALAIASLLAKKVAVGLERAGLDIRVAPHGNLGSTWEEARQNAQRFRTVAALLGIEAACILTDATLPYQRFLGRGESLLALRHLFDGTADCYLESHATQCLAMAAATTTPNPPRLTEASKDASTHFYNNLRAQGSSPDAFHDYTSEVERRHSFCLDSPSDGFLHVDLQRLRDIILRFQSLGAPRQCAFPDEMGIVLEKLPGAFVRRGDSLASVRISDRHWPTARETLACAIHVRPTFGLTRRYEEV